MNSNKPLSPTGSFPIETNPNHHALDESQDAGNSQEAVVNNNNSKTKKPQSTLIHIIYLSAAAIVGATLRVYLGRLLGGDCEDFMEAPQDFLTPLSKHICVTSNGRSLQTGGALFRDLPANLLGSFVMGLVSSSSGIRIPWLPNNHILQQDDLFHLMISTGFCGSLTTFASWNTQMVVMMDGTMTELGSQIVVALFGYLVGFMLPISAFSYGKQVAVLLHTWKEDRTNDSSNQNDHNHNDGTGTGGGEEVASDEQHAKPSKCYCDNHHPWKFLFLVTGLVVLALFVVGFVSYDVAFYQSMILIIPLAPLGALTRWKLSRFNNSNHRKICNKSFDWFPFGTWTANVVGAVCSIACTAILDRRRKLVLEGKAAYDMDPWSNAVLFAVATGFGGSLSTVSSMVKEIVSLAEANPSVVRAHAYAILTFASAMLISLIIYSITLRME
ncbi:unnamed protein product [Cylindrotheca closterium]|uniref:Fluoride ion transporter CrcB n=1 Tax=Cylindrotheca closterium TaxID=2856 RepID=A0AAD2JP97_9STRA|nr:unnamed protein product [Cylindrotheca closterium]